jgi:hypothetical protein
MTVITVIGCLLLVALVWAMAGDSATARRFTAAAITARADIQHQQVLAGDPAGTYGSYPPVTIAEDRSTPPHSRSGPLSGRPGSATPAGSRRAGSSPRTP